jgi:hypothetical protein
MKKILGFSLLASLMMGTVAIAQMTPAPLVTFQVPQVQTVGPTDVFQDIVAGIPTVGNQYATAGQIAGVPSYLPLQVPVTAFTLLFGNSEAYMILNPAGTLATGAVTLAAAPADGQRECIVTTQTVTTATIAASAGQTLAGPTVTTLTAGPGVCWTFVASLSEWIRS